MNTAQFTKDGKYLMLAFDHRGSYKKMLNPDNPEDIDMEEAINLKKEIISAVLDQTTGIMIDQDFGYPAYLKLNPDNPKPFLLPVEKSGYTDEGGERITEIQYSAKEIKETGAAGVKLLVVFNPTYKSAKKQLETSKKVLEEARSEGLPLFLEIVSYDSEDTDVVVKSVEMFLDNDIRPDVYKLEYPGKLENSKKITEMLGGIPWIILTRGADFDKFTKQLEIAVEGGCSGFLAGRALWKEIPKTKDMVERNELLTKILPERFKIISNIVLNK